jgi:hypothetical protein
VAEDGEVLEKKGGKRQREMEEEKGEKQRREPAG